MDLSVSRSIAMVVRGDDTREVLLVPDGAGWAFPAVAQGGLTDLNRAVRERYGVDVTVSAAVATAGDGFPPSWRLYACEPHSDTPPINGARWFSQVEFDGLEVTEAAHAKPVAQWLSGPAVAAVPWERRGWYREALAWCRARLDARGTPATGPVEQISCSLWSFVLRLTTSSGRFYFKASAPAFAHESALTGLLAEWFPDALAPVVALDPARHWLLTEEVAGLSPPAPGTPRLDRLAAALVRYAEIQQEVASRLPRLAEIGVPDRRLEVLPELFAELLDDRDLLMVDQPDGVSGAEWDRLRAYLPRFRSRCERLTELDLPPTLVNMDLCYVNLGFTPRGPVFFDWAESEVTSPLCSLRMFLLDVADDAADPAHATLALRDAYLGAWTVREPLHRLTEAFRLADPVTRVSRALTWRRCLREAPPHRRLESQVAIPRNMRDLARLTMEDDSS